jgi:hypothetical protein
MFSAMKNILVKKTAKLKTTIAMVALGASALAVNTSLADNWDGLGGKDYQLPSSLSRTITLNQDGQLEPISAAPEPATVSAVSEHMTISTAPGLMTVSGAPKLMTVSTAPGLITIIDAPGSITIPAVPVLMTIPAASESTTASELSELMAVSDGHELMAISDTPGDTATSNLRELRRIFGNHGPKTVFDKKEHTPISAVPEPTTIFAGAILLLPLGMSLARNLRRNKKCDH